MPHSCTTTFGVFLNVVLVVQKCQQNDGMLQMLLPKFNSIELLMKHRQYEAQERSDMNNEIRF